MPDVGEMRVPMADVPYVARRMINRTVGLEASATSRTMGAAIVRVMTTPLLSVRDADRVTRSAEATGFAVPVFTRAVLAAALPPDDKAVVGVTEGLSVKRPAGLELFRAQGGVERDEGAPFLFVFPMLEFAADDLFDNPIVASVAVLE